MKAVVVALCFAFLCADALAQCDDGVPELVCKASKNQDRSLTMRDHCRYQQRASVQLYKKLKDGTAGSLEKTRETTVIVEPSMQPDETGRYPVITRVVADTDDKGRPKSKVDPNAKTGLTSGAFLDIIFFPLLPEKLKYYQFEELESDRAGEKLFRFYPKPGATQEPLASGKVYLNPESGAVLTLKIEGLYNLEVMDKVLKNLGKVFATVDFSEFDGKYRMPTYATGGGISDVRGFKGVFKFVFEESKYTQVLKL
ncbi:MAG: hypothetical protein RMM17_03735 [Acidobacteriota bacterium]|nr:hypothetical protein [Blastocatellia bacterium]MDW8411780.1 hypothetical protein [Acidobacteriota bacterium]